MSTRAVRRPGFHPVPGRRWATAEWLLAPCPCLFPDLVLWCPSIGLESWMLLLQRSFRTSLAQQPQRERFADEYDQEPEQMRCDRGRRLDARPACVCISCAQFRALQATV